VVEEHGPGSIITGCGPSPWEHGCDVVGEHGPDSLIAGFGPSPWGHGGMGMASSCDILWSMGILWLLWLLGVR
jgi:hypothetical protein